MHSLSSDADHKKSDIMIKNGKSFLSLIENRLPGFSGGRFSFYFAAMMNKDEKYGLCALNRIFGFDPKTAHALLASIGSASEIFRLSEKELDTILGPWSKYKGSINRRAFDNAAEELEKLSENGICFIGYTESAYPELLTECEDAPMGLYIRSRTSPEELFRPSRRIAIVGTRDISQYGQEWCSRIVQGLGHTDEKPPIISGLALGTDICAHREAIASGLPTIAVMATGPEAVYPHRHREFAERMAATEGCALITDYPPGTAPLAIHFLRRNRIIAGLSDATILIESRVKGGGMMTSRLAFSYNRDVYALPGRIDDVRSQGCNYLLKEKVADAIYSVEGLVESLGMIPGKARPQISDADFITKIFGSKTSPELIPELTDLFAIIKKHRGLSLDDLCVMTCSSYSRISRLAGMLEMEGLITIDLLQRCSVSPRISR